MSGEKMRDLLADHKPVIGATYAPQRGPKGCVTVCSCMPARDYLAAGFRAGMDGWLDHLANAIGRAA